MTQPPPPPPNDPPQGGFGPPQQPPAGGFGPPQNPPSGGFGAPNPNPNPNPAPAPAPPPQSPPYGYPQAPPQAPPQGYGYPGQPGPPDGQPAYGYPSQQPAPGPGQPQYQGQYAGQYQQPPQGPGPGPGGGNGGKKLTSQMQIIIAAAVAVVLIIGGGIWFSSTGGDDDTKNESKSGSSGSTEGGKDGDKGIEGGGTEKAPSNTASKMGFQLPVPKVTDVTNVAGSWLTDTAYVKTGINQIVGYDRDKGTQLWTIPLPGQVCAATKHVTEDNRTAIAFEAAKPKNEKDYQQCTEVGAIDLNAGKLLWSKSVTGSNSGDEKAKFDEVTLSGETIAAGGTDGGAAFNLADGTIRWKPEVSAEGCYDMGYGGGAGLVTARKCGSYDDPQVSIQNLNPLTGAVLSTFKMPAGVAYASVISTKPLVVAADVGDTASGGSGISDFFSIDEKTGKLRAKFPAGDTSARCGSTEVETCQQVAVGNDRIYLPTEEHDGSEDSISDTNEIISYDLATGKTTSDRADAGDRYTIEPLRMDGADIIAYKRPPYDKGGQIVSIDGGTFKQTVLMENPAEESVREAETSFVQDYSEILYGDGRMFIADGTLSKPSDSSLDRKSYLALMFSVN
jgi:hypothetical protein